MAQFSVNAQGFEPYKNFKFRAKGDGRYVGGIGKVSALKRSTDVVAHRERGDPSTSRKSPGGTKFEAITLQRGVTHDTEVEQWANKVWNSGSGLGAEVRGGTTAKTCRRSLKFTLGAQFQSHIPNNEHGSQREEFDGERILLFLCVFLGDGLLLDHIEGTLTFGKAPALQRGSIDPLDKGPFTIFKIQ